MKKSKLLWIITIIIVLSNIVMYTFKWGGDIVLMYVSDLLPVCCALVAVISLLSAFRGFKRFDFIKKAWLMILIGILSYLFAETTYFILEALLKIDMNEAFPSMANIFWCFGYIPLLAGLSMLFVGYYKSGLPLGNTKLYGIISAAILIISGVVIVYILIPIIEDPETSFLGKVFSLFYPIADVIVVIPALILMYITSLFGSGAISKPWKFLAYGFICFTIADLLYSYLSWEDLYGNGNLIDLAWHIGYLFIALAGTYQKELIDSIKENNSL